MAAFRFIAQDGAARPVNGSVQARDLDAAVGELQQRGYLVLDVAEDGPSPALPSLLDRLLAPRPPQGELVRLVRELDMLIRGGLPLLRALHILSGKSPNAVLREAMAGATAAVARGEPLDAALAAHPRAFPPLLVALVGVGAEAGQLPTALSHYVAYGERAVELKRKAAAAVAYPAVVVSFALGVVLFLCARVVPTFAGVFKSFKIDLPLSTRLTLALSGLLVDDWPLLVLGALAAGLAADGWVHSEAGRRRWTRWLMDAPALGPMVRDAWQERFFSTLSLLVKSGVSLLVSLKALRDVFAGNPAYQDAIDDVRRAAAGGKPLSAALRGTGLFEEADADSLEAGEEAGSLPETMATLGRLHAERLDLWTKQLATLLEPVMIAVVGAAVGFIMFSLFMPMLELSNIRVR